jgi:hypothetical protein
MRDQSPRGFPRITMTERICQMLKIQLKGSQRGSLWASRSYWNPDEARRMRLKSSRNISKQGWIVVGVGKNDDPR